MSLKIKEWALEDRPREKLLYKGIYALSDAELIAILLGSGNNEQSAVDLARDVLKLTITKRKLKENFILYFMKWSFF